MLPMKNRVSLWVLLGGGALLSGFFLLRLLITQEAPIIRRLDNITSNPNPLIRHFAPTWRSLKKTVDIPYLIRSSSYTSSLPVYDITISTKDQVELLLNLPDYPREYKLLENFKKTVIGAFAHDTYLNQQAEIRYRGVSPNHWNAVKKSIQVNLPPEEPLDGRTTYRFFIGEDKGWIKSLLWNHISDKLGIMSLDSKPAKLTINGKDMGVYILIEGWEPSLLVRYKKPYGPLFSNKNIETNITDLWRSDQIDQWYNRNEPDVPATSYPELEHLLTIVADSPDGGFAKEIPHILNVDAFLRWSMATVLSGNFHQGNIANMNFYFNPETRLFEPILFDAAPSPIGETVDVQNHRLVNRLLQIPAYRTAFESLVRGYVESEENLQEDLRFYDAQTNAILYDIYQDTQKIQTSLEAMASIKRDRDTYTYNVRALRTMLDAHGTLRYTFADEQYPLPQPPTH